MRKVLTIGAAIGAVAIVALAATSSATPPPAQAAFVQPQAAPYVAPKTSPPPVPMLHCAPGQSINTVDLDWDGRPVDEPRSAEQLVDTIIGSHAPHIAANVAAGRMKVNVNAGGWRQHVVRDRRSNVVGVVLFSVHPGGLLLTYADVCAG